MCIYDLSHIIVWSGHSRWLFSCSLYIPCSTCAYFTYTLTHMTDLPTYLPQAPASDFSYQRASEGYAHLLVSLIMSQSELNPPYNSILPVHPYPLSPKQRLLPRSAQTWWGVCSRTLLQTCKIPHPLNH